MSNRATETPISNSISASGRTLLADITHNYHWADSTLQYYFGGPAAVDFDTEFRALYNDAYSGRTPDAAYAYAAQTVQVFEMIDSVISTDFVRVTNATTAQASADLVLTSSPQGALSLEGFNAFPGEANRGAADYWGFGTISSDNSYMNVDPETGGGAYLSWVLIHEIGHSLGIYHPFDGGGTLTSVGSAMDNERYTVMSYDGSASANTYGHAVTMMALDIAALQQQYGAETYAAGNSTYTLYDADTQALQLAENNWDIGRAYASIWDSGGTDTIDYVGSGRVLINLNAATLDRSGGDAAWAASVSDLQSTSVYGTFSATLRAEIINPDYTAGGSFSRVLTTSGSTLSGTDGGYSIAHGAEIENATGAAGADILVGNGLANILTGNGGNDTLIGGLGNDILNGGAGADTMNGGDGIDTVDYSGSTAGVNVFLATHFGSTNGGEAQGDILTSVEHVVGSALADTLSGDGLANYLAGGDGNDTLFGRYGNDTLVGGAGADSIDGGEGSDTADYSGSTAAVNVFLATHFGSNNGGDAQDDILTAVEHVVGSAQADTLSGDGFANHIRGEDGNDTLFGRYGNDTLLGGDGDDVIDGGYGNDELRGDAGNDTIAGGFGADTVIGGTGDDVITGSALSDLLFGGDGMDFVNGGYGHDRVNGGNGADRFFHVGVRGHGSDWIQDYDATEGDTLLFGIASADGDDFRVNFTHTASAAGERSGDDAVEEAFVIYIPTGQIMWALVDGAAQAEINIVIGGVTYDLLA